MPFTSEAQRKYCWVRYNQDIRDGKKPSWDCEKWERETSPRQRKNLKKCKCRSRSSSRRKSPRLSKMSPKERSSMRRRVSKTRKIHTGARGGKYVIVKGKKIYV
ncbi:MAG: hypothetical protein PHG66_00025 [Candidatus Colwellbacteria bacterium]|nr:hypothetical protein [Candidatus Colwellbacteria bacterium]